MKSANRKTTRQARKETQATVRNCCRGGKEFGGLKLDQAERFSESEWGKLKLETLVEELSLDSGTLKNVTEENFYAPSGDVERSGMRASVIEGPWTKRGSKINTVILGSTKPGICAQSAYAERRRPGDSRKELTETSGTSRSNLLRPWPKYGWKRNRPAVDHASPAVPHRKSVSSGS